MLYFSGAGIPLSPTGAGRVAGNHYPVGNGKGKGRVLNNRGRGRGMSILSSLIKYYESKCIFVCQSEKRKFILLNHIINLVKKSMPRNWSLKLLH